MTHSVDETLLSSSDSHSPLKVLFLLVDGLSDTSLPELKARSPLAAADIPHIHHAAAHGRCGLLDPVIPGLTCGSDTAHLSILGYNPFVYYGGRGTFESIGCGLTLSPGDLGFKCVFSYFEPSSGMVLLRKVDSEFVKEAQELCAFLQDNLNPIPGFPQYSLSIQYSMEHRCGIKLSGPDLDRHVTGTDPKQDNRPLLTCQPTSFSSDEIKSQLTCSIVNCLSEQIVRLLQSHPLNVKRVSQGQAPANIVLFRGCGSLPKMPTFEQLHGMKGFVIAPTAVIRGLGISIGLDVVNVPGATGDHATNYLGKAMKGVETLQNAQLGYQFGFVHVKAVDHAGHDGDLQQKLDALQSIDAMVGLIMRHTSKASPILFCFTGDHSTLVRQKIHSNEPVPFLLCKLEGEVGSGQKHGIQEPTNSETRDDVVTFNELCVAKGSYGRFPGSQVMSLIKECRVHWA